VNRVAALYDIHGNIFALEAALNAVDAAHADTIVFGGDLALGPFPRAVLDSVMTLGGDTRFIRGNCDRLVVDAVDGRDLSKLPPGVRQAIEWTASQIDTQHRDFLDALPLLSTLNVTGVGDVLLCHATPKSDEEIVTVRTPVGRMRPMIEDVTEKTIVCGHTHMQFDRTVGETRIVNAGSVGMPYGTPGAHWLLLGPDVQLMRTGYDLERAAEAVRHSGYPTAEEFAEYSVLRPSSEEEMLRRFTT
jgi:Icc-related predicted phosphoesterase